MVPFRQKNCYKNALKKSHLKLIKDLYNLTLKINLLFQIRVLS